MTPLDAAKTHLADAYASARERPRDASAVASSLGHAASEAAQVGEEPLTRQILAAGSAARSVVSVGWTQCRAEILKALSIAQRLSSAPEACTGSGQIPALRRAEAFMDLACHQLEMHPDLMDRTALEGHLHDAMAWVQRTRHCDLQRLVQSACHAAPNVHRLDRTGKAARKAHRQIKTRLGEAQAASGQAPPAPEANAPPAHGPAQGPARGRHEEKAAVGARDAVRTPPDA